MHLIECLSVFLFVLFVSECVFIPFGGIYFFDVSFVTKTKETKHLNTAKNNDD